MLFPLDSSIYDIPDAAYNYLDTALDLLFHSLAPNTRKTYISALASTSQFADQIGSTIDWSVGITPVFLLMFIGYLKQNAKSAPTVRTILAAISYIHNLQGLEDPTKFFLVLKTMKGYSKVVKTVDKRQPISPQLLSAMCNRLPDICATRYEAIMWNAIFQVAYCFLLRVSEYTLKNDPTTDHCIRRDHISVSKNGLSIWIKTSKADQDGQGVNLFMAFNRGPICPASAMRKYLEIRPDVPGPLFIHGGVFGDLVPVTPYQVNALITKTVKNLVPEGLKYTSHSFRIGSASYMKISNRFSDDQIMACGRWSSHQSYEKYCRDTNTVTLPSWTC